VVGGLHAQQPTDGKSADRGGSDAIRCEATLMEAVPKRMFEIKHIDHVVLRVTDSDAMLHFYVEVLGCTLEKVQSDIGLYQLRAGASLIDLVPVSGKLGSLGGAAPGAEGRNLDHFCLGVAPFDGEAILAHLHAHGHQAGPVESRYGAEGDGPSIYVKDPEGNVVELKGPPWTAAEAAAH
jgi:catechol 2,3-dioxygenase-like lactoylglutathione lyase family enzyme